MNDQPQQPAPGPNAAPQQPLYPGGYPQTPPRKSHKKVWLIIAGVVIVGALLLCGGIALLLAAAARNGTGTASTTGQSATAPSGATSATTSSAPQHVGGTITDSGVAVTLVSAHIVQPGQFDTVPSGDVLVQCEVKIVNSSGTDQPYNVFDFHSKTSAGNVTDATFTQTSDALNSGTLTPNGTVSGSFILAVPQGDHGAEMTWTPSFLTGAADHQWLLGI